MKNIFKKLFGKTELPFTPPIPPDPMRRKEQSEIKEEYTPYLSTDLGLKILVVADTHDHLSLCEDLHLLKEPVDVCLVLGDVSLKDYFYIKREVKAPIYGVLGNHDSLEAVDMDGRYSPKDIHGKVVEVKGVKIAGIGGSIRYKQGDYPMMTDEESVELAEMMDAANILISHDSPKYLHGNYSMAHSGLQGITHYIEKHNPPVHLHGHHHINEEYELDNGTKSICVHELRIIEV